MSRLKRWLRDIRLGRTKHFEHDLGPIRKWISNYVLLRLALLGSKRVLRLVQFLALVLAIDIQGGMDVTTPLTWSGGDANGANYADGLDKFRTSFLAMGDTNSVNPLVGINHGSPDYYPVLGDSNAANPADGLTGFIEKGWDGGVDNSAAYSDAISYTYGEEYSLGDTNSATPADGVTGQMGVFANTGDTNAANWSDALHYRLLGGDAWVDGIAFLRTENLTASIGDSNVDIPVVGLSKFLTGEIAFGDDNSENPADETKAEFGLLLVLGDDNSATPSDEISNFLTEFLSLGDSNSTAPDDGIEAFLTLDSVLAEDNSAQWDDGVDKTLTEEEVETTPKTISVGEDNSAQWLDVLHYRELGGDAWRDEVFYTKGDIPIERTMGDDNSAQWVDELSSQLGTESDKTWSSGDSNSAQWDDAVHYTLRSTFSWRDEIIVDALGIPDITRSIGDYNTAWTDGIYWEEYAFVGGDSGSFTLGYLISLEEDNSTQWDDSVDAFLTLRPSIGDSNAGQLDDSLFAHFTLDPSIGDSNAGNQADAIDGFLTYDPVLEDSNEGNLTDDAFYALEIDILPVGGIAVRLNESCGANWQDGAGFFRALMLGLGDENGANWKDKVQWRLIIPGGRLIMSESFEPSLNLHMSLMM